MNALHPALTALDCRPHAAWVGGRRLTTQEVLGTPPQTWEVTDPSTGAGLIEMEAADGALVDLAVGSAVDAFHGAWAAVPVSEKGRILHRISLAIAEHSEQLALLESVDAGVPLTLARGDVAVAARYFEFYAGMADKHAGTVIPLDGSYLDYTLREPWGVCGIIVPFNFPLQQICRSVAPALATGNTVVLKSSERSPLLASVLARLCGDAGLPPGAFNVVHGLGATGELLIDHPEVAHLTFTGSREVGSAIMARCARRVLPVTMELGGKSAQIVLDESRLKACATAVANVMFRTSGQACSASSRILVREDLRQPLADLLVQHATALRVGPACEPGSEVGPLISPEQRDRVLTHIELARTQGAALLAGGAPGSDLAWGASGNFVLPTVLDDVASDSDLSVHELFGPVLGITPVTDAAEALSVANDSPFGLVAGVWTSDIDVALDLARSLEVGQVFVNTYGAGGGVELPFGGRKGSGFGREKGLEALAAYTQVKNVCVKIG